MNAGHEIDGASERRLERSLAAGVAHSFGVGYY